MYIIDEKTLHCLRKAQKENKKAAENPSWHRNQGMATAGYVRHRGGLPEEKWIGMDLIMERWQWERDQSGTDNENEVDFTK